MKHNYVLDTNVLIHDTKSLFKYKNNNVYIPIYVIEELDNFKKESSDRGRSARQVSRQLDELRLEKGSLSSGVPINEDGFLQIFIPSTKPSLDCSIDQTLMDHAIMGTAFAIRELHSQYPTIFVTMDTNLRIRADALGMATETYDSDSKEAAEYDTGITELDISEEAIESFFADGYLQVDYQLSANTCVLLRNETNLTHTALARYDAAKQACVALKTPREGVMGLRPRNKEQSFALDLLLNDDIKIVTLVGKAGTGKTLLALAAAIQKVTEENVYEKITVARPIVPMGNDVGFLPGLLEEKLSPYMQGIFDNLDYLFTHGSKKGPRAYADLMNSGQLQVEPLTFIRGRSLPNQYILIDEIQNCSVHEVKTIISRAGENTKIILTGDPEQIDTPKLDQFNNGLTVVMNKFKGSAIAGHIVLTKGERSELADLAATLL